VDKPKQTPATDIPDQKEIMALANRAQAGDKSALPPLRRLMENPEWVDALGGDLAEQTRLALIAKYTGKNLLVKETLTKKLKLMAAELAGPNPSPLERLLVDRVVLCWLHLHYLEATYTNRDSVTLELGAYYQRCISAAQKRYLSAIKTLAVVRKLTIPMVQVNIARKQVNVAACPAPPPVG